MSVLLYIIILILVIVLLPVMGELLFAFFILALTVASSLSRSRWCAPTCVAVGVLLLIAWLAYLSQH